MRYKAGGEGRINEGKQSAGRKHKANTPKTLKQIEQDRTLTHTKLKLDPKDHQIPITKLNGDRKKAIRLNSRRQVTNPEHQKLAFLKNSDSPYSPPSTQGVWSVKSSKVNVKNTDSAQFSY